MHLLITIHLVTGSSLQKNKRGGPRMAREALRFTLADAWLEALYDPICGS